MRFSFAYRLVPLVLLACDFSGGPGNSSAGGEAGMSAGGQAGGVGGAGGGAVVPQGGAGGAGGAQGDGAAAPADSGTGGTGTQQDAGTPPASDAAVATYPPGPYGFRVGEVMANLSFTGRDGRPLTLGDLRDRPGVRLLLWSSGAEWCSVCRGDVPTLKMVQASKGPDGLIVLETLHQSSDFTPSNLETLRRWDNAYKVNYTLAVEKSPPYEPRSGNPVVWIMNARTMKILTREQYTASDVVAAVNAAFAQIK